MNLESYSADEMPEDAWEQRTMFADKLYEIMKEFKDEQKYEDIALNSLLIATLSFLWVEAKDNKSFLKFVEVFCESVITASESWVKDDEEKDE